MVSWVKAGIVVEEHSGEKLFSSWKSGSRAGEEYQRGRGLGSDTDPRPYLTDPLRHSWKCSWVLPKLIKTM